jgi:DNA-binding transcriptional ArsR family regulator
MDTLLSAVHSERERQCRRLAILGKIERLARELDVDEASGRPERARSARGERQVRPGRAKSRSRPNPSGVDIARFIAKHGPVGRAEIHRALGGDLNSLDGHLKRLTGKGTIDVEGERPHRRYRAPNPRRPPEALAASESPSPAPVAVASCAGAEDLLALISEHAPVTTARLREVTELGYQEIIDWGRLLARRHAVAFEGEGLSGRGVRRPSETFRQR